MHHHFPEGFLVKTNPNHKYLALHSKEGTGKRKGTSPLSGTGFSGQFLNPKLLVIIGLGNSCIGFVTSGRRNTFIFIINPGWCSQSLFQGIGPYQGCRSPNGKHFHHFFRNVNPSLRCLPPVQSGSWEKPGPASPVRWVSVRSQGWIDGSGKICRNVIPLFWHFTVIKINVSHFAHSSLIFWVLIMSKKNGAVNLNMPRVYIYLMNSLQSVHHPRSTSMVVPPKPSPSIASWTYDLSFLILFLFQLPKNRDYFLMIQLNSLIYLLA